MVRSVPPEVAQSFGVLRRAVAVADELPERMRRLGASGEPTFAGLNPGLARRVASTADEGAVYVVPGAEHLCVVSTRGDMPMAMGCAESSRVLEQGMWVSQAMSRTEVGRRVEGVVPDGVAKVRITRVGKDGVEASVSNNGFSLEVPGTPVDLIWLDDAGSVLHRQSLGE